LVAVIFFYSGVVIHLSNEVLDLGSVAKFRAVAIFASILFFGACFENVFSPKGWQKNFPKL